MSDLKTPPKNDLYVMLIEELQFEMDTINAKAKMGVLTTQDIYKLQIKLQETEDCMSKIFGNIRKGIQHVMQLLLNPKK